MNCPTCGRDAAVLVHNVADGTEFCFSCAPPSFNPHAVLTLADLDFMKQYGIDPQLPDVLRKIVETARKGRF